MTSTPFHDVAAGWKVDVKWNNRYLSAVRVSMTALCLPLAVLVLSALTASDRVASVELLILTIDQANVLSRID